MKLKQWLIIVGVLGTAQALWAQQPTDIFDEVYTDRVDSLLNDVFFGDEEWSYLVEPRKHYQFLYWRSNFDSGTYFAGREIGEQQNNLSGQLYYLHSLGFYAGVSGAWYSQLDPGYRTTVLTAGYANGPQKMSFFRYRLAFDYFLYHDDDPDFDPAYSGGINTGMTLKSKHAGVRVDAYHLLGDDFKTSLTVDGYSSWRILRLGTYDRVSLEPEVSLFWGAELVEYQLNEVLIDPETNIIYDRYFEDTFGLMNIQLEIPLNIRYKQFDIEASWIHNFPHSMQDGLTYPESSFFRFSVGYLFNL